MKLPKQKIEDLCSFVATVVIFATYFVGFCTFIDTNDWTFICLAIVLNLLALGFFKYYQESEKAKLEQQLLECQIKLLHYENHAHTKYEYKSIFVGITSGVHNHKEELERGDNTLSTYLNDGYEIWRQQEYTNDSSCFYYMILRKELPKFAKGGISAYEKSELVVTPEQMETYKSVIKGEDFLNALNKRQQRKNDN